LLGDDLKTGGRTGKLLLLLRLILDAGPAGHNPTLPKNCSRNAFDDRHTEWNA